MIRAAAITTILLGTGALAQGLTLDTFELDDPVAAMADCIAGRSERCGPVAGAAAREVTLDDLRALEIAPNAQRGAAPAAAPLPSIDLAIFFDYDSARPRDASLPDIRTLALALADPRFEGARVLVLGHTDAAGSADYNRALSERRAETVRDQLALISGLPPGRFEARGRGEDELADASDPEGAANRRVQIVLLEG